MLSAPKRPALGFTQPSVQWVPVLYSGVKRAGIDVDHCRAMQSLRMSGALPILPPVCLHAVDSENVLSVCGLGK
jgi:hypothetical protein